MTFPRQINIAVTPLGLQIEFWFTPEPDGHCHAIGIQSGGWEIDFPQILKSATVRAIEQHEECK